MSCSSSCKYLSASIVGVIFTLFGTLFVLYWPTIFESFLTKNIVLRSDSTSYKFWQVPPIPIHIEFYLWNWTNKGDIHKPGFKPDLQELGPYVFREHREKIIQGWTPENSTVTYFQNRTWFFVPSLSKGQLDDMVTSPNIPAITAVRSIGHNFIVKKILNEAMKLFHVKIYVTKSVRQFLFEGYTDPLLDLAALVPHHLVNVSIPFDKFGYFYARNGSATYDGIYNMKTGEDDLTQFGKLALWDYVNSTSFYVSHCGNVNGSAGEFFTPNQEKTKIELFSSDVCRTLSLTYKEDVYANGINGYRFWGDDNMLVNASTNSDNWCFCPPEGCSPNGILDISTCKWGAPLFISFPHFYHADPFYRNAVNGMDPNETLHQMYIDIEPRSGIPIEVSAAFQINVLIQPVTGIDILENVPKIYFPAIWFRQTANVDGNVADELRLISRLPKIVSLISYFVMGIGLTLLLVAAIFYATIFCKKEDEDSAYLRPKFGLNQIRNNVLSSLRGHLRMSRKIQQNPTGVTGAGGVENSRRVVCMRPSNTQSNANEENPPANFLILGSHHPNVNTAAHRRNNQNDSFHM